MLALINLGRVEVVQKIWDIGCSIDPHGQGVDKLVVNVYKVMSIAWCVRSYGQRAGAE